MKRKLRDCTKKIIPFHHFSRFIIVEIFEYLYFRLNFTYFSLKEKKYRILEWILKSTK